MHLTVVLIFLLGLMTQALPEGLEKKSKGPATNAHLTPYRLAPCVEGKMKIKHNKHYAQGKNPTDFHSWTLNNYGILVEWGTAAGVCFFTDHSCKKRAAGIKKTSSAGKVCFNVTDAMNQADGFGGPWNSYKFVRDDSECRLWEAFVEQPDKNGFFFNHPPG